MQSDALAAFVGQATVNAVRDAVTVIIVSGYLIYKSPILFAAAAIVIPVIIVMMQLVSHRIKEIQAKAENALGDYMHGIEEMSNGMRTVKISGQEGRERDRLFRSTSGIRDLAIRLQSAQALVAPSIDLVSAFVYVLVIGGGGYMVLSGNFDMDAASIIAFLLGLVILFDPARLLAQFFAQLQASLVILDGVRSVYRETPSIVDAPDAQEQFDARADIVFDGVRFGYGQRAAVRRPRPYHPWRRDHSDRGRDGLGQDDHPEPADAALRRRGRAGHHRRRRPAADPRGPACAAPSRSSRRTS
jgi:ATP-binding cassette, subfamily B, bacterial